MDWAVDWSHVEQVVVDVGVAVSVDWEDSMVDDWIHVQKAVEDEAVDPNDLNSILADLALGVL